jgi:hypothetical protein
MEIKLSSSDAMSPSHSKLVKNFKTDAEMTELLPIKYWHFSVTKFLAKVYMCLVTWDSAYVLWVTSHKFRASMENGLFEQPPSITNLEPITIQVSYWEEENNKQAMIANA